MTTMNDHARRSPGEFFGARPLRRLLIGTTRGLLLIVLGAFSPIVQSQVLAALGNASVFEGNSGTTILNFPVTFGGTINGTVTVSASAIPLSGTGFNAATGGASCSGSVDFISFSGVVISSVNGALNIPVTVCGDITIEPDQHIFVSMSIVSGGAFCTSESCGPIGTIVNDDGPPSITVADVTVSEPVIGTKVASVPVKLHHPWSAPVSVAFATRDGTARAATTTTVSPDYTGTSGTLSIPVGSLQGTVPVTIRSDGIRESNQTFFVDVSSPVNATILDGTGQVTIRDTTLTLSVGGFQLVPDTVVVESGDTVAFDLTWTTPGQLWTTLDWIDFRIGHGKSALLVMWDEETNLFSLCEISGKDANAGARARRGPPAQCGPGALPGSSTVLYTPMAQLRLEETTVVGNGSEVTLHLVVSFGPDIHSHDYAFEVAAADDDGGIDAFTRAGTVQVE